MERVLAQSFKNFEYLIIDGASKDRTLSIIQSYSDPRIRLVSEKDKGIYDAMNKGITQSKGEWIYFMNAGDHFHDEHVLRDLFEATNLDSCDLLYGRAVLKNHPSGVDIVIQNEIDIKAFYFSIALCHQVVFTRKNLFNQLGLFKLDFPVLAEQEWFVRYFTKQNRSKFVNRIVVDYDTMGNSYKKRIIGIKECNRYGWENFPLHINLMRMVRHPFLIGKVYALRALQHNPVYAAYRKMRYTS